MEILNIPYFMCVFVDNILPYFGYSGNLCQHFWIGGWTCAKHVNIRFCLTNYWMALTSLPSLFSSSQKSDAQLTNVWTLQDEYPAEPNARESKGEGSHCVAGVLIGVRIFDVWETHTLVLNQATNCASPSHQTSPAISGLLQWERQRWDGHEGRKRHRQRSHVPVQGE